MAAFIIARPQLRCSPLAAIVVPDSPLKSTDEEASASVTLAIIPRTPESGTLSINQVEDGSGGPA